MAATGKYHRSDSQEKKLLEKEILKTKKANLELSSL
jgi:hypothetical protein